MGIARSWAWRDVSRQRRQLAVLGEKGGMKVGIGIEVNKVLGRISFEAKGLPRRLDLGEVRVGMRKARSERKRRKVLNMIA